MSANGTTTADRTPVVSGDGKLAPDPLTDAETTSSTTSTRPEFPMVETPSMTVTADDGIIVLRPAGDWTVRLLHHVEADICGWLDGTDARIPGRLDLSGLKRIDTSGAHVLRQIADPGRQGLPPVIGHHDAANRLLQEMACYGHEPEPVPFVVNRPVRDVLERIGRATHDLWLETFDTMAVVGETLVMLAKSIANPTRIRWLPTVAVMESAGFNAIPIVMVLSFFIGAVVAFMGASTLSTFGATIFTVDLVGIAVLREFGVLITAIILAGRSDSAFTAQLGSMRMTGEVDAMHTLGLDPMEWLVIPRVIALLIMTPVLAFLAILAGLTGGGLVSILQLDLSPTLYLLRLQDNVGIIHFYAGMAKAPVFAIIMAIIGCRQGLNVGNDVISLGSNTTAAVVQAVFMVIVVDAVFAMVYLELGI